jgi:1-acyl-sn-glycerol-3-phosphate acyltransferase
VLYRSLLTIRTVVFNTGYYGSGILFGTISLMLWPLLPYSVRWRFVTQWNRFVMFWLRFICRININVVGARHPELQPYVVMAKHQSTWETLFLQYYFAPISTILKKELLRIPFFGWGLASLRPIAIDRSNPIQALKDVKIKGIDRLQQGINVLIFPEGTRIPLGKMGSYARSGADMAVAAGRHIVPIAHNGAECWPHKHFLKYPGTITVIIGEPISTEGRNRKDLTDEVKTWIEDQIGKMPPARKDGKRPWLDQ